MPLLPCELLQFAVLTPIIDVDRHMLMGVLVTFRSVHPSSVVAFLQSFRASFCPSLLRLRLERSLSWKARWCGADMVQNEVGRRFHLLGGGRKRLSQGDIRRMALRSAAKSGIKTVLEHLKRCRKFQAALDVIRPNPQSSLSPSLPLLEVSSRKLVCVLILRGESFSPAGTRSAKTQFRVLCATA